VVYPQTLARGLLALADITATRYFNYTPVAQRDPVLSAQGDRLRAEVFSACNGIYARLDLLQSGIDGKIDFGTTNVDIGLQLRTALARREGSSRAVTAAKTLTDKLPFGEEHGGRESRKAVGLVEVNDRLLGEGGAS
jgi:hypothetical protein